VELFCICVCVRERERERDICYSVQFVHRLNQFSVCFYRILPRMRDIDTGVATFKVNNRPLTFLYSGDLKLRMLGTSFRC
jgi:hypothetical protein